MTLAHFKTGIDVLLDSRQELIRGRKIGLVTHPAALDLMGRSTDQRIAGLKDLCTLAALFSPEHGLFNAAGAGEAVPDMRHPIWNVPIHSLYGTARRPTAAMLEGLDLLIVDLQDIAIRAYTYSSTLRYILEAAATHNIAVVVTDRPDPLACIVDGPMLDPTLESFVGAIPSPLVYGMTIGETARYLKDALSLDIDLQVLPMSGYTRNSYRAPQWQPWIPPSPSIRTWETAILYPATVLLEALPALDHGRSTSTPFQLIGAPWLDAQALASELNVQNVPGIRINPCAYCPTAGSYARQLLQGIRLTLTDPLAFKPIQAFTNILTCIRDLYGSDRLWAGPEARPDFFDQLAGNASFRAQLQAGIKADTIIHGWSNDLAAFEKRRHPHLLYSLA